MTQAQWHDPVAKCVGLVLDGRAQTTGIKRRGGDRTVLWIVNASHTVVKFKLPEVTDGMIWRLLIDTNQPELEEPPLFDFGEVYEVTARSTLLLELMHFGVKAG